MTPLESIAEKESLKGDYSTLNSSSQLYNAYSSLKKSQKPNFVMLLPNLGNKQHKVNKHSFERGLMSIFQKNFKDKRPYFFLIFSCFNFLLKKKFISCLFDVYCRLAFDLGGRAQLSKQEAAIQDRRCGSEDRFSQEGGDDRHHPATYIPLLMTTTKPWI